jgi:YidC/Oxa1 family membrane protein insertase
MSLFKFFLIIRNIIKILFSDFDVVFFSENKRYQSIFKDLIIELSRFNKKIIFLTSDKDDILSINDIKSFYIGDGFLRDVILQSLNCKLVIMTLTDLGYHQIKKSKNVKKYIYLFHGIVGGYSKTAFHNYDIILSPSKYHNNLVNLNNKEKFKKVIINTGYLYFDYLKKNINNNYNAKTILIAPSWSRAYKNFINEDFDKIIKFLLDKDFEVIFRPHPEHYKRSTNFLSHLKSKYLSRKLKFDNNVSNIDSFNSSCLLITDFSGIALEFSLSCHRYSIYINDNSSKHMNQKEINYLEENFKKNFSYNCDFKDFFENFDYFFKNNILDKQKLLDFAENNFFNYEKNISKISAEEINKILNFINEK